LKNEKDKLGFQFGKLTKPIEPKFHQREDISRVESIGGHNSSRNYPGAGSKFLIFLLRFYRTGEFSR